MDDTAAPEPPGPGAEPRWPMATAVLAATILYVGTPHRGRVPGWWLFPVVQLVLLGLLIAPGPRPHRPPLPEVAAAHGGPAGRHDRRHRPGRLVLAHEILVTAEGVTATVLLGRGAAIWVANVIIFSLWYWEFDRGGPAERAAGSPVPASFAFPRERHTRAGAGGVAAGLSGLPVPGLHQRHRVQSHRHPPGAALGQADHDGPVGAVAGDRDPGGRQGHQRPARLGATPPSGTASTRMKL